MATGMPLATVTGNFEDKLTNQILYRYLVKSMNDPTWLRASFGTQGLSAVTGCESLTFRGLYSQKEVLS